MSSDLQQDFEEFIKQRVEAGRAYTSGDWGPFSQIVTHTSPSTFFAPQGGAKQGADTVAESYAQMAKWFAPGGDTQFEMFHMGTSGDLGYWVGFQHSNTRMADGNTMQFKLRLTEIYRREAGSWKLIHRHADTQTEPAQWGQR
jgi:ketosteroid isomerase-like protein